MKIGIGNMMIFIFLFVACTNSEAAFLKVEGIDKERILKVKVSFFDDNTVYVLSESILFKTQDGGKIWKKVFVAKGENLIDIFVDNYIYDVIYLASQSYIYRIREGKVEKIFNSPGELTITSVVEHRGNIYVGTTQGLYITGEDFIRWRKLKEIGDQRVSSFGIADGLYILTSSGLYLMKNGKIKKIKTIKTQDTEITEEENSYFPLVVYPDKFNFNNIYVGTSNGLFILYKDRNDFRKVYLSRISKARIRDITQTFLEKDSLYLATDRGIFRINIKKNIISSLFEGLPTKDTYSLDFTKRGKIWVATSKGLFIKDEFTDNTFFSSLDKFLEGEPSIAEIQKAALDYNEVSPDKIKRWRRSLKFRALFPTVSLDYDKSVYGSYTGRFAVGPRDWGVSFSWDMGNLIWSFYEDEVDTRSRLNTQLRINILDDVNGLYYERLRIKIELADPTLSKEERLKKEIRLRELTASLDGYTGGYFSYRLKQLQTKLKD